MRAASQASAALDGPSTSGRCAAGTVIVLSRRRGSSLVAQAHTHMPIGMHNVQPIPDFKGSQAQGVVKGARTTATPRLTPERVMQFLAESTHEIARHNFGAFFSSELGGIVTEPGFMVVNIDDHMVHKGDAVVESVLLVEGYLYQLDEHLQRFQQSAELAGLPLPYSEERLRRILLDTAAASLKMNGMLTFWLSRGRGGFGLGQAFGHSFYALLSAETMYQDVDRNAGIKAVITPVEPRPIYFTVMRNVSQIQNAVARYEALARGADMALFVDSEDTVLLGDDCSIGMLTPDLTLVLPPADTGLGSMAVENLVSHTMKYAKTEEHLTVERIERRLIKKDELLAAQEAFAISTRLGVVGISHLDDQPIGPQDEVQGEAGPVALALHELLIVERQPQAGSQQHTEVPYGYLTGMKSQLV